MKKIYLVTYIDHDSVEGYVNNLKDFDKWLKNHNKRRKEEGDLLEDKKEFKIEEINILK